MTWQETVAYSAIGLMFAYFAMMVLVGFKIIRAPWFEKLSDNLVRICVFLFVCWAIFVFAKLGYKDADNKGWFARKRVVSVTMSSNWLKGEFKLCYLSTESLVCDPNAEQHRMEVTFRGQADAKEWNCQFNESIQCKVNADSPQRAH